MAPSSASFPKLSSRNYQQWALDMEARLNSCAAWRIVNGSETAPSFTQPLDTSERKEMRDFENRMDLAAGEIWSCIEVEEQTHVQAIRSDPRVMWAKLEAVHVQKQPGTRFNTYNSLFGLHLGEAESLTSLSTRASQYKADMKALRPPTFSLTDLDDELTLMSLLRALPAEYTSLKQTLLLDDSLTLSKLQETFVTLENQPAFAQDAPVLAQRAESSPSTLCAFCDKPGHSEVQCFAKRNAMAKAKENTANGCNHHSGKGRKKEGAGEAKEAKEENAASAAVSEGFAGHASALLSSLDCSHSSCQQLRRLFCWIGVCGVSACNEGWEEACCRCIS